MKRFTILFVMLAFSASILKAQMNTGSKFLSGQSNFGINSYSNKYKGTTSDPEKHFNVNLNTRAGYFLKNRIAIGGFADLDFSKTTQFSTITTTSWMIGPMARYYVEYGAVIPFAEASVGFGMNNRKSEFEGSPTNETKYSIFGLKAGVGADYFLNESIAFEGIASYYMNTLKPKGDTGDTQVQNGFGLTVGVIFYFGSI